MSSQLLTECIEQFDLYGLEPQFQSYLTRRQSRLLASSDVARGLVELSAQEDDAAESAQKVLMLLLDEARMGLENGAEHAGGFLETVEMAIQTGVKSGTISQPKLMDFAALYRWIDLPVPQSLLLDFDNMEPLPDMGKSASNFDLSEHLVNLARECIAGGGSAFDFFQEFDTMLAAVPEDIKAALVSHIATEDGPLFERCALLMLLSGPEIVQNAVVLGLTKRNETSTLMAETLVLLPMIRGWFAAGSLQASLDRLIKNARRKGTPDHSSVSQPQILEIVATITDGVGAQGITIRVSREEDFVIVMILLKAGHGIKDSFIVYPEDGAEAQRLVRERRVDSGANDISSDTLRVLLEGALADGLENGCLPPPEFLDVIEICGLFELRPQELGLPALIDVVDPEQKVRSATEKSLERWINDDEALSRLEHHTRSWFEDTEVTRKIVAIGRTEGGIEGKLWKFLETRRDIWARRFLQTAVMLKDKKRKREWKTLIASAHGLMEGRALESIPLMEDIMYTTIEAAYANRM